MTGQVLRSSPSEGKRTTIMARPQTIRTYASLWLVVAALSGLACFPPSALGQGLGRLLGAWTGKGRVVFKAGKAESIKCNAYNRGENNELSLVIRCASTSYKIEIRSKLQRDGEKLSGNWEERTYNATGTATGRMTDSALSLSISGGGFTGKMNVSYTQTSQTIRITTDGIDMKSVDIDLARSG